jgi:nucleoside-diphosphate-sugar epimerase
MGYRPLASCACCSNRRPCFNSANINLNVLEAGRLAGVKKFFYSSSACIYPEDSQIDPENPKCSEDSVYPAAPDSEYGREKPFSERLDSGNTEI